MLTIKHLRENIRKNLRLVTDHVADCVAQDMTDINRYAEDFYCGLLNKAFGYKLRNLNREMRNCPAIDLADDENGIGVQVTSTVTRAKVTGTLKKFFEGNMDARYSRLILLVIGKEDDFRDPFRVEREFDFDPDRDIWDTPTLIDKLENIENIDTLKAVDEYLQKQLSFCRKEREPLLDLPMGSAMKSQDFVGRQEELRRIGEELAEEGVAFLSGLGGMGKTELALRYGQDYRDAGRGLVYFVRFTGSLRRTVVENIAPFIPGFGRDGLNEDQIYDGAMAILKKCDAKDLLILDNADDAEVRVERLRRELSKLPIRVLVTTRAEDDGAISVDRLENETLYGIFRNHKVDITEPDMDELIAAVDGHTLTVDLMARLLRRERRINTYKDLRDALTKKNLENADLGTVGSAYSGAEGQARINEHLKAVFRVAKLGEAERTLLRFASLLPNCGLDVELFANAAVQKKQEKKRNFFTRLFRKQEEPPILETPRKVLDTLQTLADGGWLEREVDVIKIHPVVCIVCREELKPNEENCRTFLRGVNKQCDLNQFDKNRFLQLAELFSSAADELKDPVGEWAVIAGFLWRALGKLKKALQYEECLVEKLEENPHIGKIGLARAYNNVGSTYGELGEYSNALEYQLKALAILEEILQPMHPTIGKAYDNLSWLFHRTGEFDAALECALKALAIFEHASERDCVDLAKVYSNVGLAYGGLGDQEKSLKYAMLALEVLEHAEPPLSYELARAYNNMAGVYQAMGDYGTAKKYGLKAYALYEEELPPTHFLLAYSCNNLAWSYYKMGEYETALEFMRRAVDIAARSLPEGHPDRVSYRDNLEWMERELRLRRGEE